jgi:hypothetical protein
MNRQLGLFIAFALISGPLTGCARPQYDEVDTKYATLPAGQGRIFFYQPSNPGAPVSGSPYVLVNGSKAGRTAPGNFFFVDRSSGQYTVKIEYSTFAPIKLELSPGQMLYVRVNKSVNGLTFNEEPKDKAIEEMADMTYHGASSRERRALKRAYPAAQTDDAARAASPIQ